MKYVCPNPSVEPPAPGKPVSAAHLTRSAPQHSSAMTRASIMPEAPATGLAQPSAEPIGVSLPRSAQSERGWRFAPQCCAWQSGRWRRWVQRHQFTPESLCRPSLSFPGKVLSRPVASSCSLEGKSPWRASHAWGCRPTTSHLSLRCVTQPSLGRPHASFKEVALLACAMLRASSSIRRASRRHA